MFLIQINLAQQQNFNENQTANGKLGTFGTYCTRIYMLVAATQFYSTHILVGEEPEYDFPSVHAILRVLHVRAFLL